MAWEVRPEYDERIAAFEAGIRRGVRVQLGLTCVVAVVAFLAWYLALSYESVFGVKWLYVAGAAVALFVGAAVHGWYLLLEVLL